MLTFGPAEKSINYLVWKKVVTNCTGKGFAGWAWVNRSRQMGDNDCVFHYSVAKRVGSDSRKDVSGLHTLDYLPPQVSDNWHNGSSGSRTEMRVCEIFCFLIKGNDRNRFGLHERSKVQRFLLNPYLRNVRPLFARFDFIWRYSWARVASAAPAGRRRAVKR